MRAEFEYGFNEPKCLRTLFVGGLYHRTTDESLIYYFRQWGEVINAVVLVDPVTHRSRGFGYIRYLRAFMVDNVQRARPHILHGRILDVRRVIPRQQGEQQDAWVIVNKLLISGLKNDVKEYHLREYFKLYGNILSCKIRVEKNNDIQERVGLIEFDDYDAVDKICQLKYHQLKGSRVDVKKDVRYDDLQLSNTEYEGRSNVLHNKAWYDHHGGGDCASESHFNYRGQCSGDAWTRQVRYNWRDSDYWDGGEGGWRGGEESEWRGANNDPGRYEGSWDYHQGRGRDDEYGTWDDPERGARTWRNGNTHCYELNGDEYSQDVDDYENESHSAEKRESDTTNYNGFHENGRFDNPNDEGYDSCELLRESDFYGFRSNESWVDGHPQEFVPFMGRRRYWDNCDSEIHSAERCSNDDSWFNVRKRDEKWRNDEECYRQTGALDYEEDQDISRHSDFHDSRREDNGSWRRYAPRCHGEIHDAEQGKLDKSESQDRAGNNEKYSNFENVDDPLPGEDYDSLHNSSGAGSNNTTCKEVQVWRRGSYWNSSCCYGKKQFLDDSESSPGEWMGWKRIALWRNEVNWNNQYSRAIGWREGYSCSGQYEHRKYLGPYISTNRGHDSSCNDEHGGAGRKCRIDDFCGVKTSTECDLVKNEEVSDSKLDMHNDSLNSCDSASKFDNSYECCGNDTSKMSLSMGKDKGNQHKKFGVEYDKRLRNSDLWDFLDNLDERSSEKQCIQWQKLTLVIRLRGEKMLNKEMKKTCKNSIPKIIENLEKILLTNTTELLSQDFKISIKRKNVTGRRTMGHFSLKQSGFENCNTYASVGRFGESKYLKGLGNCEDTRDLNTFFEHSKWNFDDSKSAVLLTGKDENLSIVLGVGHKSGNTNLCDISNGCTYEERRGGGPVRVTFGRMGDRRSYYSCQSSVLKNSYTRC